MNNLISIITPNFNCEVFIKSTIESVISQTYSNWEMLIVDDCSTDRSYEIALDYAKKDSRIKVLKNEKNSGAAISRNLALDNANGDYIAFLDSDDLWEPNKLEVQLKFMEEHDCDFCFTKYVLLQSITAVIICRAFYWQRKYQNMQYKQEISHWKYMVKITFQKRMGLSFIPIIRVYLIH